MKEEMRTFGYLCPQCGKTVMGTRSVFALEASNAEVECACGKSALKVEFDGTEYHIYVPCGICGETHEAHCPPERVLRGATALGCAKTPLLLSQRLFSVTLLHSREWLPVRKYGALCCPDFPLASYERQTVLLYVTKIR